MVGKASLIVILGFSLIFGVAGQYWNRSTNRAIENFVDYYDTTMAHNIAVSAANIACDSVYFGGWKDTLSTTVMPSGHFSGGAASTSLGSFSITTKRQTWHGVNYMLVTAASRYSGRRGSISDTVKILFRPRTFDGYAFFSQNENGVNWATGDTVWGPFHTEGDMYISGRPVFWGRATWVGSTVVGTGGNHAQFFGGSQSGSSTHVQVPLDITQTTSAATQTFPPTSSPSYSGYTGSNYAYDVYLTFNSDGTVTETDSTRKYSSSTSKWSVVASSTTSKISLGSISNAFGQAVIVVNNGDVHVTGTVDGSVTVAAIQGSGSSSRRSFSKPTDTNYFDPTVAGNAIIDGSIVYKDNPVTNPGSNDMLGIVADNGVALNSQTSKGDITINAAIFARKGSFTYLDYDGGLSGYPSAKMGELNLIGSITQNKRGAVSTLNTDGSVKKGYEKNYKFDERFYNVDPPYYPAAVNQFQIISWRE